MTTSPLTGAGWGPRLRAAAAVLLVFAAVAWFDNWTVFPDGGTWKPMGGTDEFYNALVSGFRAGHLWMDTPVDPGMRALADPYDPVQNALFRAHDASYFHGHYYLYFGVAPAVLYFWPARVLGGHYASQAQAALCFALSGYAASLVLLLAVRRRYFPRAGILAAAGGALALGLATMLPALLRRPYVYENAIAFSYAASQLALLAAWHAIHAGRRRWLWAALASLAFGCAAGGRPIYALGALCFLLPLAGAEARQPGAGRFRRVAAFLLPAALVGAALAWYNQARFGSPFEFGQTYQLSGAREGSLPHFGLGYLLFNLRVYLLEPAQLTAYFPYVAPVRLPAAPAAQFGVEDPYGVLPNLPFIVLALASFLAVRGRPLLRRWWGASLLALAGTAAPVFFYGGACTRYMVDFLPLPVLLAAVAVLWLEDGSGARAWIGRAFWLPALAWSAAFAALTSIQHEDILQTYHPAAYARAARLGDAPALALDRWRGARYGAVVLSLKFPSRPAPGESEPLVVSGRRGRQDYLFVHYLGGGQVAFAVDHTGTAGPVAAPLELDLAQPHRVELDWGAFYPPPESTASEGLRPEDAAERWGRVRLRVDGRWLLNDLYACYDPSSRRPSIGTGPPGPMGAGRFSGEILAVRRDPELAPSAFGALELLVLLPSHRVGASEPVFTTGVAGRGDLVRIEYLDAGHVRLVHDRWGYGGSATGPINVRAGAPVHLVLSLGSLFPAGPEADGSEPARLARDRRRLWIAVDGRTLLDREEPSHPATAESFALGRNPIGASLAEPAFTGQIVRWLRRPAP